MCYFEEKCAQTRILFNTPSSMSGNNFLVHGTEKGLTSVFMHFSSFKICCHNILRVNHAASHVFTESHILIIFLDKYFPTQNGVLYSL